MGGGIFLIKDDETLIEMSEKEYDSEELLQELLAKYPNLLAGDQIDSENPRRWLLVSREINVPDSEEGYGRFSLDHLFRLLTHPLAFNICFLLSSPMEIYRYISKTPFGKPF